MEAQLLHLGGVLRLQGWDQCRQSLDRVRVIEVEHAPGVEEAKLSKAERIMRPTGNKLDLVNSIVYIWYQSWLHDVVISDFQAQLTVNRRAKRVNLSILVREESMAIAALDLREVHLWFLHLLCQADISALDALDDLFTLGRYRPREIYVAIF